MRPRRNTATRWYSLTTVDQGKNIDIILSFARGTRLWQVRGKVANGSNSGEVIECAGSGSKLMRPMLCTTSNGELGSAPKTESGRRNVHRTSAFGISTQAHGIFWSGLCTAPARASKSVFTMVLIMKDDVVRRGGSAVTTDTTESGVGVTL